MNVSSVQVKQWLIIITCLSFSVLHLVKPTDGAAGAAITAISEGINIAAERSEAIYNSLAEDSHITPADVIVAYVETIPIIGNIVKLINGNEESDKLEEIKHTLFTMSNQQERVINLLLDLQSQLSLLVTRLGISAASSVIKRCNKERLNFLRYPNGTEEVYRLQLCYDTVMEPVSKITGILTEDDSEKIFQQAINNDGFCDGSIIGNIYKHLFNYILMGCETAVLSESIKTNQTSKILLRDCEEYIRETQRHLRQIYDTCTNDPCNTVKNGMKLLTLSINSSNVSFVHHAVSDKYPWFTFIVLQSSEDPDLKLVGNLRPNSVTFIIDKIYITILWTPFKTQNIPGSTPLSFTAEFSSTSLLDISIGMNVTKNLLTRQSVIVAYVIDNSKVSHINCDTQVITDNAADATANKAVSTMMFPLGLYFALQSWVQVVICLRA